MDINLELYKVFYYVATTLSFSEASRQLFLSQSAVSQSIKQLEHKLGHSLFVRSTKKVQLTPEGEILLQHVKPAIRMLSDGEDLLANSISPMEQIRIAASDTICRYFLIDYFKRFHKEHPEIRIGRNSKDFGTGFYCTIIKEQAQGQIPRVCHRAEDQKGTAEVDPEVGRAVEGQLCAAGCAHHFNSSSTGQWSLPMTSLWMTASSMRSRRRSETMK